MATSRAPAGATRAPSHVPVSGARMSPSQLGGPSSSSSAAVEAQAAAAAAAAAAATQDALSVVLCTAGYDHTIRFWEAWSGMCSKIVQHPDSQINKLAISPDKRFLAVAANQHVRLYDCAIGAPGGSSAGAGGGAGAAATGGSGNAGLNAGSNPVATFDGHAGNVTSLAWHCDAKWLVTGSEDGTLKIWDTRTSRPQRVYDHHAPVNDVVIHPNQGELVSCDQAGSVKVWDLGENGCSHELVPEEEVPIRSVTIASDGSCLVAGNNKGNVYVWRIQSGTSANTADPSSAAQLGGDDGSNGNTPNTPGGDFTDLQPVTKFRAHDKYLTRCLLSPDVRYLATCSADTTVKIWSTSRYEFALEKTLVGHQRWVWDAAFSADSAYLVTASSDHVARLWELASGETVRQYNGHNKAVVCCALNDSQLEQ